MAPDALKMLTGQRLRMLNRRRVSVVLLTSEGFILNVCGLYCLDECLQNTKVAQNTHDISDHIVPAAGK